LKLLVSWLRELVDVDEPPAAIASTLSMSGFEVASVEAVEAGTPAGTAASAGPDAVIDFEVTANRPDCLSVIGLAREAATAFRRPLRLPWDADGRPASTVRPPASPTAASVRADAVSVTIEDPDLCPRYAVAVADVKVAPSPAWLADRLTAAGVRPINNVVDVTNYVLIEYGHPLHAFDVDRLAGSELRARRARAGETIVTLDGEKRELEAGMLVIADAESPQAVAGVMGGAASEVWAGTKTVALESAYFAAAPVRRTSKRLGLKTEASSRFERGADIAAPALALERACALLEQIGAGRRRGEIGDCYPAPRGPVQVRLRRERIARLIGVAVPDEDVVRIFRGLGFDTLATPDGWVVTIPTHRVDISREADLIEEVARHHGYDKVPTTFPPLLMMPARPDPRIARANLLRQVLTAGGFSEAISFSFIETAAARPFVATATAGAAATAAEAEDAGLIPIAYPLSEKFAVLRPSLIPGLVDAVAHNRRRERADVRLFEIGSVFSPTEGEQRRLAIAWAGTGSPEHWSGGTRPVDFFDAKGVVERVAEALRLEARCEVTTRPWLTPGRTARVLVGGTEVGSVGALAPAIAHAREIPGTGDVYVAELDIDALDRLAPERDARFEALPRFPSVVRDVSIVVDEGLPSERVRATIRSAAPATLVRVEEFDRYKGKNIPEGRYSLSLRLTFNSPERTLVDAEVQQAMERIVAALVHEHGAVQR
jgi:phenylalanyl-tRNA synthetase beta chain